jgi:ATP phosphoribosyltransferase
MTDTSMHTTAELTLALSKGRILEQALPLLARAGIVAVDDPLTSRRLVIATNQPGLRLLLIRATDVPTYVEYGAADLGIAGKDVLMEYAGTDYYEPLDLGIARCRLVVAGMPGRVNNGRRLRVATKYARSARDYFARQGVQAEIIKLYGSMELAPLVGLAECIVDLVDTGNTLRVNGLIEQGVICAVSSRLIVNKAAQKTKHRQVSSLVEALRRAVAADER